jgi:hypothetical protein
MKHRTIPTILTDISPLPRDRFTWIAYMQSMLGPEDRLLKWRPPWHTQILIVKYRRKYSPVLM